MLMLAGISIIGQLPLAVMGGLICRRGLDHDRRLEQARAGAVADSRTPDPRPAQDLLANYLVMLSVVAIAAVSNLITAVFVGVLAAMFLFVRRNSGSIIHRELRGDAQRSLRQRSLSRMRELEREGWRIVAAGTQGRAVLRHRRPALARSRTRRGEGPTT
jgi:MFS superfamily sulfate permease-like transporter